MTKKAEINEAQKDEKKAVNKRAQLEDALLDNYSFRFNVITGIPEIRDIRKSESSWERMNDYQLNSIVREMKLDGYSWASKSTISEIMESDFSVAVDPILNYFEELKPVKGNTEIQKLANTITTEQKPDQWLRFLTKWIVAAVANAINSHACENHTMIILGGEQGKGKSTWIRNLCPPDLKDYYIESALDPDNKDHLIATTQNFIFNLDDTFAHATKKDANKLKDIITKPKISARRPYGRYAEDVPKRCSFAGTANDEAFLYDPTGSRRFLAFWVTEIDNQKAKKIDINKVWAEALNLHQTGFRHWFNSDEEAEVNEINERFQVQSAEYELVIQYFRKPRVPGTWDFFLTSTEIATRLEAFTRRPINQHRLGAALKKAGFVKQQKRLDDGVRKWVYPIDIINQIDKVTENTTAAF